MNKETRTQRLNVRFTKIEIHYLKLLLGCQSRIQWTTCKQHTVDMPGKTLSAGY